MNTDFLATTCKHYSECQWEKRYNSLLSLNNNLEFSLSQANVEHAKQLKNLKISIKAKISSKLQKKQSKILSLKQALKDFECENKQLQSTIELSNGKIRNLRKCRQQSFDTINYLEAEIQRTKVLFQTPTKPKKVRKSVPGIIEIKAQVCPFEINEVSETKKKDQEKLIESQSILLQAEKQKSNSLKNKFDLVLTEKNFLIQELGELEMKLNEYENKAFEVKQTIIQEFTAKIEKLKIENSELKFRLNEYEEKESGISTSDCENVGVNELGILENYGLVKDFEDILHIECKNCIVHKKVIENTKHDFEKLLKENSQFKKELEKRKIAAFELNKILIENKKAFDEFRKKFDFAGIHREIDEKQKEKSKLQQEINQKTKEKLKIQQEIDQKLKETQNLQKKILRKTSDLSKLTDSIINKKITAKPEPIEEYPKENNLALQISNQQKYFPEDYKKRRNINSWSFTLHS